MNPNMSANVAVTLYGGVVENNNNSCIPAQKLDFLCTITFYGLF